VHGIIASNLTRRSGSKAGYDYGHVDARALRGHRPQPHGDPPTLRYGLSQVFALSDVRRSRFVTAWTYLIGAFDLFKMAPLHAPGMTEPLRRVGDLVRVVGMLAANLLCRRGRGAAGARVLVWAAFAAATIVSDSTGGSRSLAMLRLFVLGSIELLPAPAPSWLSRWPAAAPTIRS